MNGKPRMATHIGFIVPQNNKPWGGEKDCESDARAKGTIV